MKENTDMRLMWVDFLKISTMFFIYLGHFGEAGGKLYSFVFLFHVPLFFFVSGFFSGNSKKPLKEFLIEKTSRLLIPYYLFACVWIFYYMLLTNFNIELGNRMLKEAFAGIRNQVGPIWFINCIYVVVVFDFVILKIFKKRLIVLIISVILFIISVTLYPVTTPRLFWNIDSAIYYYIYFTMGRELFRYLGKSEDMYKGNIIRRVILITTGFITLFCLFFGGDYFWNIIIRYLSILKNYGFIHSGYLFLISLVIIAFFVLSARSFRGDIKFSIYGRDTLILCGVEYFVKDLLTTILGVFGITISLNSPYAVLVYSGFCLIFACIFIVPFFRVVIDRINQGFIKIGTR